jgi:hypothetical protein
VEAKSDLDRLQLVLDALPDEELMQKLERQRGRGRDDYPVRATWNSVLAGIVFQHESVESLRRELSRNGELRDRCGFDPLGGEETVPSRDAYTRFLKTLMNEQKGVEAIFDALIEELKGWLPDLGKQLAVDTKAVQSHARGRRDPAQSSDPDANWGVKTKKGRRKDGTQWEKVTRWFGYKLHLLVDSHYELPLGWKLTRASVSDTQQLIPLVKDLRRRQPDRIEVAEQLSADRGYDSGRNNAWLWDEVGIKPLIDSRMLWKDGEETRLLDPTRTDSLVYDEKGQLYCHCPASGERREMAYQGFEKDRQSLKYRCPAAAYGLECRGRRQCGTGCYGSYGRVVRVPLELDRRIFTPIARSSYAWSNAYKKRTAVERVNSRIDGSFQFERHYIRGKKKMQLRMGLALMVMLALAVGHLRAGEKEKIRSLVQPRAA